MGAYKESCRCTSVASVNPDEKDLAPDAEDSSIRVPTMMTDSRYSYAYGSRIRKDFSSLP